MGVARGAAGLLLHQAAKSQFSGSVLQLGRQTMYLTRQDFLDCARRQGVDVTVSQESDVKFDDSEFFGALGFSSVESCDVSAYQGSGIVVDLNKPVPPEMHEKYDVIFDGGTSEHIFDQVTLFTNLHKMLKVGGKIIHLSPSSGHVDHGFYMYSPTMFWEYYHSNQYELDTTYVFRYEPRAPRKKNSWEVYDYTPGSLYWMSNRSSKPLGVFVVARKTEDSISGALPQQGKFAKSWVLGEIGSDEPMRPTPGEASERIEDAFSAEDIAGIQRFDSQRDSRPSSSRNGLLGKIKSAIRRRPFLYKLAISLRYKLPFGKMPPKIGRF